jgi:chorismate mutase
VNSLDKKCFYIVDSDALPEVFKKVVAAKELIDNGTAKNITTAIKMCDLSRSAFYKYKDCVFKAKENAPDRIELQAILVDRVGVFSNVSNTLFKKGANIITMNQAAPENGLANVKILIGIDGLKTPVDELISDIERLNGVVSVKSI